MTAYLDSSAILGVLLGQKPLPPAWEGHGTLVASVLVEVECMRTLDRLRTIGDINEGEYLEKRAEFHKLLPHLDLIPIESPVLRTASGTFPGSLRSLDAIHLSSAIHWREANGDTLTFVTHDKGLARVAAAMGFSIAGI